MGRDAVGNCPLCAKGLLTYRTQPFDALDNGSEYSQTCGWCNGISKVPADWLKYYRQATRAPLRERLVYWGQNSIILVPLFACGVGFIIGMVGNLGYAMCAALLAVPCFGLFDALRPKRPTRPALDPLAWAQQRSKQAMLSLD